MNRKFDIVHMLKYVILIVGTCTVLFPLYVVFVNAFKKEDEGSNPFSLPASFLNFENFANVIDRADIMHAFLNTFLIIIIALLGNIILGTMVAYAVGRIQFRGKRLVIGAFLIATIIPTITTQVVTFSIIQAMGIYNTLYAPILLFVGADVIQIYIYLQFIKNIPYELDESAMMDGASLLRIYRSIILPLLGPATATLIILKTINIYNELYIPFLYMPKQDLVVVSTAIMRFAGNNQAQWTNICAAILIIMIPTILLYLFLQKYIFSGVTSGAVKG
ncbi:raffinose/stachyose/melibiose transport system permease protein [Paenibacillus sp. SORGH_AS306]|uniref:carbohydrate ABC transporter permease n=1 Tax=unclassified Paenibacillus TaxID=185978 RepID=UPI00278189DA|nr:MULTISPECIES: carbohydrate ABC transporter permease [unclassified Paenibacillus]MDQ1234976.1 raffinose/stachyose/melibiose transport system permease protein [Paenibacillus sp. SORGH_AS_0306]MDR6112025.1 raffinose/stachyose/melibiose transport system permease protein [Paenibacillus sp. SORGH_AS_0338]